MEIELEFGIELSWVGAFRVGGCFGLGWTSFSTYYQYDTWTRFPKTHVCDFCISDHQEH